MTLLDQAGPVREELNLAVVDAFVKGALPSLSGQPVLEQFPGGASNLTYLLRYPDRELILRRPPFGHKAKSAHDMGRETTILKALRPVYPYVPEVLAYCDDPAVMGCDFYLMERLHGIIPRKDLPEELTLDVPQTRTLCLNVLDKLIELHQVDPKGTALEALGRGEGYVRRQVEGWSDRYRQARTEDAGDFEAVMAWLAAKQPDRDIATCVIHNDFRFDNVVLDPQDPLKVIGVLDWEMATLGDPLMDLGNALAYWVQADDDGLFRRLRRQPTHLPGMLTRDEVVATYTERMGLQVACFDFYLICGLFRLAVIAQQIYFRYRHGQAKNPAFADFIHITNYLEKRCQALIQASAL